MGCSKKPLHINYFDLKRAKNVAICKLEDGSAETKAIHGGNEQQHIHHQDRKKLNEHKRKKNLIFSYRLESLQ